MEDLVANPMETSFQTQSSSQRKDSREQTQGTQCPEDLLVRIGSTQEPDLRKDQAQGQNDQSHQHPRPNIDEIGRSPVQSQIDKGEG